jgi:hypothetical protein
MVTSAAHCRADSAASSGRPLGRLAGDLGQIPVPLGVHAQDLPLVLGLGLLVGEVAQTPLQPVHRRLGRVELPAQLGRPPLGAVGAGRLLTGAPFPGPAVAEGDAGRDRGGDQQDRQGDGGDVWPPAGPWRDLDGMERSVGGCSGVAVVCRVHAGSIGRPGHPGWPGRAILPARPD